MCKESDSKSVNYDEILEKFKPLVYKIVNRMNYGYVDKEDLIQAGMIGLFNAISKYDNSKNSFINYASIYIISAIKEELRNNKLIVLNKEIISIIRKIKQLDKFSIDEVSTMLNVSKDKVFLAYLYKDRLVSLDKDNENEDPYLDIIEDRKPIRYIEYINKLSKKDRILIYDKYFYNLSQKEISEKFNISQSSISRMESKALRKLKNIILYSKAES